MTNRGSRISSCKGAIVIGGHINGLGIARSLAGIGIPAAVILTKTHDLAQYSRYVEAHECAFELAEQPEQLLEALERRSSFWKGWALFPTNDEALAAVEQNGPFLESRYPIIAPPSETIPYFLDKERMRGAAQAVGIPVPPCYGPADQATAARSDIQFPVIVKPVAGYRFSGRFGGKLLAASDRAGLCDAVTRVAGSGNRCYIHDLVPGADDQIYCHCVYLNPDGTIRAELTVRKLRQSPPFFGVARVAELAGKKDYLSDATVAFLRRIRYHGMAVAEFKLDPRDGSYRFLEVNARSVIYNALLSQAGMDLAGLAWSGRIEGRHEKADIRPWPGVWVNLHADLLYSTLRGRAENLTLKGFISPYLRPKIDAVWSTRDPMPFIRQWSWTMERGIKGLFGL